MGIMELYLEKMAWNVLYYACQTVKYSLKKNRSTINLDKAVAPANEDYTDDGRFLNCCGRPTSGRRIRLLTYIVWSLWHLGVFRRLHVWVIEVCVFPPIFFDALFRAISLLIFPILSPVWTRGCFWKAAGWWESSNVDSFGKRSRAKRSHRGF